MIRDIIWIVAAVIIGIALALVILQMVLYHRV